MSLALLADPHRSVCSPHPSAGDSGRRHHGDLAGHLNTEWARWSVTPTAVAVAADWGIQRPALAGVGSPEDLRAGLADRDQDSRDAVLIALLELAQAGDQMAARTVCQAMLGKAVRIAGSVSRRTPGGGDGEDALADAVAALWQAILTYPVRQRRSRVAANISLSTLALVQRGHVRSSHFDRPAPEVPMADVRTVGLDDIYPDPSGDELAGTPDAELLVLLAWAVRCGVLSRAEALLLTRVYDVDDQGRPVDGRVVAAQEGISWPALRQRCHRLARKLGAAAVAADLTTGMASCGSVWSQRTFVHRLLDAC